MELRMLQTDAERELFARRMQEARLKHGVGFKETSRSHLGKAHLQFAELYGLFEEPGQPADRMMSGFTMHDLASFPQSYNKPDLTHYPAWSVMEGGELWSFSKGAGIIARRGCAILLGLRMIRAMVAYPIAKPWDLTGSYTQLGFTFPCEPVEFPYAKTNDGQGVWVQPMVLEGAPLAKLVGKVFSLGFETLDNHRIIRFENPIALKPSLDRPSIPINHPEVVQSAEEQGRKETNGTAHM